MVTYTNVQYPTKMVTFRKILYYEILHVKPATFWYCCFLSSLSLSVGGIASLAGECCGTSIMFLRDGLAFFAPQETTGSLVSKGEPARILEDGSGCNGWSAQQQSWYWYPCMDSCMWSKASAFMILDMASFATSRKHRGRLYTSTVKDSVINDQY